MVRGLRLVSLAALVAVCAGCPAKQSGSDAGPADAGCSPACSGLTPYCSGTTCVVCTSSQGCGGSKPLCDTTGNNGLGRCVQCTTNSSCSGTTPFCDVPSGTCVASLDAGVDAGGPPPPNDTCATAQVLVFDGGVATVSGDTTNANNSNSPSDQAPTCSTNAIQTGPDVMYQYTLTQTQDVTITATPTASASLAVYVRKVCSDGSVGNELACDTFNNILIPRQPAGTYFVWVDTDGDRTSAGPFTLTVQVAPPTPVPPNDDCTGAIALAFDGGTATVTGDTTGASNSNAPGDTSPSCATGAITWGKDVVYSYTLTQAQDVTINLNTSGSNFYQPIVYVRAPNQCASGAASNELACNADTFNNLTLFNQQPGTYYAWVDGDGTSPPASFGPFTLTVTLGPPHAPPPNDTCATAQALTLPATVQGTTIAAKDDYTDDCGTFSINGGSDVVYSFTTTGGQLTATVTPDGGNPPMIPYLYLRTSVAACANTDGDGGLGCNTAPAVGSPGTLVVPNLDAGTYYLIVDSDDNFASGNSTQGDFTLTARVDPQPAPTDGSCAAPIALSFSGTTASVTGDTLGATTTTAMCPNQITAVTAPEVAYTFTAPTPDAGGKINGRAMVLSQDGDLLYPAVSFRQDCPGTTELDCEGSTTDPFAGVAVGMGLDGGAAYFVHVGSYQDVNDTTGLGRAGPFTLRVDVAEGPEANDSCANPIALTVNTSVSGTTLGANDDLNQANNYYTQAADGGIDCSALDTGPDVVYSFQAASSGPVTITAVPQPGYEIGLGLLSSCAPNSCIQTVDDVYPGYPAVINFTAAAGSTYFISVDSAGLADNTARGGFTLEVSQ